MKLAAFLLIIGLTLIGLSISMPPYLSPGPLQIDYEHANNNSEAYYSLRDAMLTPKYSFEDFGVCFVVAAAALAMVRRRAGLSTPRSKFGFIIVALFAPVASAVAYGFDVIQAQSRGEFPPWGDSIGIPMMGLPAILLIGLAWSSAHLGFLPRHPGRTPFATGLSRESHPWLLAMSGAAAIITLVTLAFGAWWYAASSIMWGWFYLALAAARLHESQTATSGSAVDHRAVR